MAARPWPSLAPLWGCTACQLFGVGLERRELLLARVELVVHLVQLGLRRRLQVVLPAPAPGVGAPLRRRTRAHTHARARGRTCFTTKTTCLPYAFCVTLSALTRLASTLGSAVLPILPCKLLCRSSAHNTATMSS
jgi:hypothetical protein